MIFSRGFASNAVWAEASFSWWGETEDGQKPARVARGKAKAKAKGRPKGKAKAAAKKKPEPKQEARGRGKKAKAALDEAGDGPHQAAPAPKRKRGKGKEENKMPEGNAKEEDGAGGAEVVKVKCFAKRRRPAAGFSKLRWEALREAFEKGVKPVLEIYSAHEDCSIHVAAQVLEFLNSCYCSLSSQVQER